MFGLNTILEQLADCHPYRPRLDKSPMPRWVEPARRGAVWAICAAGVALVALRGLHQLDSGGRPATWTPGTKLPSLIFAAALVVWSLSKMAVHLWMAATGHRAVYLHDRRDALHLEAMARRFLKWPRAVIEYVDGVIARHQQDIETRATLIGGATGGSIASLVTVLISFHKDISLSELLSGPSLLGFALTVVAGACLAVLVVRLLCQRYVFQGRVLATVLAILDTQERLALAEKGTPVEACATPETLAVSQPAATEAEGNGGTLQPMSA